MKYRDKSGRYKKVSWLYKKWQSIRHYFLTWGTKTLLEFKIDDCRKSSELLIKVGFMNGYSQRYIDKAKDSIYEAIRELEKLLKEIDEN